MSEKYKVTIQKCKGIDSSSERSKRRIDNYSSRRVLVIRSNNAESSRRKQSLLDESTRARARNHGSPFRKFTHSSGIWGMSHAGVLVLLLCVLVMMLVRI